MARTRSDYRLAQRPPVTTQHGATLRPLADADRAALPALLLDAYRGTIDDEGEDLADAVEAVDVMLGYAIPSLSFVAVIDGDIAGFSFTIEFDDIHYIDPVVVAPDHKRTGVGTAVVSRCLDALASAGIEVVGATITDGNTASESLFRRLGFVRRGTWAPASGSDSA